MPLQTNTTAATSTIDNQASLALDSAPMSAIDQIITAAALTQRVVRVVMPLIIEGSSVKAELPSGVFTEVELMVRTIITQGFKVSTDNTLAGSETSTLRLEIEW